MKYSMKHRLIKLQLWFKAFKRLWTILSIEDRFSSYELRISEIEEQIETINERNKS